MADRPWSIPTTFRGQRFRSRLESRFQAEAEERMAEA